MNCKKLTLLNISLGLCLVAEAVVYEPFADVDNTLPSERMYNETFGNNTLSYNTQSNNPEYNGYDYADITNPQRTIGGGAVYYCPYCGAALDPDDHTELERHAHGNAYEYTGRAHHCRLPLNGEESLLLFALLWAGVRKRKTEKGKVKTAS